MHSQAVVIFPKVSLVLPVILCLACPCSTPLPCYDRMLYPRPALVSSHCPSRLSGAELQLHQRTNISFATWSNWFCLCAGALRACCVITKSGHSWLEQRIIFADLERHCSVSHHFKRGLDMKRKSCPPWSHYCLLLIVFPLVLFSSVCSGTLQRVDHQQTTLPSTYFSCAPVADLRPRSRALLSWQGMPVF